MTHEKRWREFWNTILNRGVYAPELSIEFLRHLREVEAEAIRGLVTPDPNRQWVKCSERMPTMEDSDDAGQIWLTNGDVVEARHWAAELPDGATHWRTTGLVTPEPPKETR